MTRSKDERGQVLSSLVAVLAVVAIVGGLLVLFGTRGDDSAADEAVGADDLAPKPSASPTALRATAPTSAPTPAADDGAQHRRRPRLSLGEPTTRRRTQPPATSDPARRERPAVEIYNNTARKGLADDVASRARQAGWTVAGADNWHGKIVSSTVYYPPGMQAEAGQLAQDLGIGRIKDALDEHEEGPPHRHPHHGLHQDEHSRTGDCSRAGGLGSDRRRSGRGGDRLGLRRHAVAAGRGSRRCPGRPTVHWTRWPG